MRLKRWAEETVTQSLVRFPAVGLVGPRQCGKTTLARQFAGRYFDLELDTDQDRLTFQWDDLVEGNELIILDEAQAFPKIFPKLRSAIDGDRKRNGRFLILGSVSPSIMKQVSESLAGRIHMVELSPLILGEVPADKIRFLWLMGGFPDGGILGTKAFPYWQKSYLDLLIKRDLPLWGLSSKPSLTQRLLRMLAASAGQLFNASQLGNSLGISHTSIQNYLEYLEGGFLVFRLPPYFCNLSKRLVKMPKLYFSDTGIRHCLLDTFSYEKLCGQSWLGHSWENFVIQQIISRLKQLGKFFMPYFFRTSDGYEIDLVVEAEEKVGVEVKMATSVTEAEILEFRKKLSLVGASKGVLVYRGKEVLESKSCWIMPLWDCLERWADLG
ncbi:MAG: ATP-binding protein [Puniceicoccales bacterium]|jgi:predicted AAA+ superfamily ATPase|nr:ATP-binding protein [Puniceicoccales bacterium]